MPINVLRMTEENVDALIQGMEAITETEFERAAQYLRGIAGTLDSKDLLYFYARFKFITVGPNTTPKPGFFDFQGKQKWQAWSDLDQDLTRDEAMLEYVERLEDIDPEWSSKDPADEKSWNMVSRMANEEEEIEDDDKTVFDWVKEGNLEQVKSMVLAKNDHVAAKDSEGMGLLHWSADRGWNELIEILLEHGADVNLQDNDGQTPLHYAASCGHLKVVNALLQGNGVDTDALDRDGLKPADVASDDKIKEALSEQGSI